MGKGGEKILGEFGVSAKLQIKTEVPSTASGRMVDAITDAFSPITESLGFVGDKIRLKRQQTLREITRIAAERIEFISKPIKPIPHKFLLPLLEKASLEDVDDTTLVTMWANLIATASTEDVAMLGQYVSILSNIVPEQVRIIEKMFDRDHSDQIRAGHLVDNYYFLNQTGLPSTIDRFVCDSAEELAEKVVEAINVKGVAIDTINVYHRNKPPGGGDDCSVGGIDDIYSDKNYYHFENLVRIRVIDRSEIKRQLVGKYDIDVIYYVVNPVGIDLYACCNPTRLARESLEG